MSIVIIDNYDSRPRLTTAGPSTTSARRRRVDRPGGHRGIYSGAIGYFSLSGAVDLNKAHALLNSIQATAVMPTPA